MTIIVKALFETTVSVLEFSFVTLTWFVYLIDKVCNLFSDCILDE